MNALLWLFICEFRIEELESWRPKWKYITFVLMYYVFILDHFNVCYFLIVETTMCLKSISFIQYGCFSMLCSFCCNSHCQIWAGLYLSDMQIMLPFWLTHIEHIGPPVWTTHPLSGLTQQSCRQTVNARSGVVCLMSVRMCACACTRDVCMCVRGVYVHVVCVPVQACVCSPVFKCV